MKKYLTLILFSLLFFSSDSYSQWCRQYIDANITIEDVRFIDKNTGWLCGADLIYKTTNGGENWINQPNQTNNLIRQIHPVDEEIVYACGYRIILKTSNGGKNWITLREGANLVPQLNGLWFYNKNIGWFCGSGVVMKTINGGNSFIDSMFVDGTNHDVFFKDSVTGIICGSINVLRTTNSGQNWYEVPLQFTQFYPYIYRETFVGDNGWLASRANAVYKTTNFGITWDSISIIPRHPSFGQTNCISFSSELTGYTGGDSGKIHKSTDGGYTWVEQNTSQFGVYGFLSMYAFNDSIVWAVGGGGKILYTENGGGIIVHTSNNNPDLIYDYYLNQNYPNPFNPLTEIEFGIRDHGFVSLKIYNILGEEIAELINQEKYSGMYKIKFDATNLSSGIYFYVLKIGNSRKFIKSMLLLK